MSYDGKNLSRLAMMVATVTALSLGMSQDASAQTKGTAGVGLISRGVVQIESAHIRTFNWLAKPGKTTRVRYSPTATQTIGHGSWICSPAGFGRKSRCYAN